VAVRRRPAPGAPGQHFLRSSRLAAGLVADAGIAPDDLVVDIGAGAGALTRALLDSGARVIALEPDPELAALLRARFRGCSVRVREEDARTWPWPVEPFRVVANLPFSGSGAILAHLLRDPTTRLRSADLILQWEAAHKHTAVWPTTLRGVYWAAWYELSVAGRLAASAFSPSPSVAAGVVRITRRADPRVDPAEHEAFRRFVARAFREQRPLTAAPPGRLSQRELRRLAPILGFDASARPRDLDARQWAELFGFARSTGRAARPRVATRR
jgi:23S rRNA (adenine-N6)-dimethyltransferase